MSWRARWIWAAAPAAPRARHTVALRRTVTLTVPTVARVCADSRYVLFVDGDEIARGPVRINPRRRLYDEVELPAGEHCLGVLATFYGRAVAWWMPGPTRTSAVRVGGFLFETAGGEVVSDGSWRALLLDGWTETPPTGGISRRGGETIDTRALPAGWADAGFDDAAWPAAAELSGNAMGESGRPEPPNYPHGPYGGRPIGFAAARPVEVTGDVVVGTVVADVEGPAGSTVTIHCSEGVESEEEAIAFSVTLDGTRRQVETFDLYGLRQTRADTTGGAVVHRIGVNERTYPVTGDATFSCSDERLTRIWEVGRRTVTLCSLDAYVDCPTREQRAWTGDSVVHQMVDLATNADWRMARWHPRLAAEPGPDGMLPMAVAGDAEAADLTVIPDWALHWVHSVHNLWRYVGDAEEIRRLLPVVEGVLRWFDPFLTADGLLTDVVGWVIIDWASVYTEGACAALNGLYARSLLEFADMAEWLGDAGRSQWARGRHSGLRVGFEQFWDPGRSRYVDSFLDGARRPMASQHGQAAAIVGALAPPERHAALVDALTDGDALVHAAFNVPDGEATPNAGASPGGAYLFGGHPPPWWDVERQVVRAQPFFRYVVHDALAAAGRADLIAAQCLDWLVALERCPTSWTETWFGGTVSHGWSSTPTRDLVTQVLGVQPDGPGFTVARIEPHLGDLAWAAGRVPCPAGMIDVRVDAEGVAVTSPVPFHHGGRTYEAGTQKTT